MKNPRRLRKTLVPTLTLLTIGYLLLLSLQRQRAHVPVETCLLYDKPMRTASSTITNALTTCAQTKGWRVAPWAREGTFDQAIKKAFETPASKLAILSHMWISVDDITHLHTHCKHVVYITSCAKLTHQLWSAAKMLSHVRKTGNTTLDALQTQNALAWLRENAHRYARMYEAYPYMRVPFPLSRQADGRFPDVPPNFERVVIQEGVFEPDYVVRKANLQDDLHALLQALGCGERMPFQSLNVHQSVLEGNGGLDDKLERRVREASRAGDGETYARLMRHAELNNAAGLARIRRVMSLLPN